jgi:hypothetical protein
MACDKNYQIPRIASGLRFLFLLLLMPPLLLSQKYDFDVLKKKYAADNAVFLKRTHHTTIKIESGALKIYSDISEDLLLLNDKASMFGEKSIYYSYFNNISEIHANTLIPSNKKFKSVKVQNIVEKNDIGDGNFYDDSKSKSFVYSDIQPGARTVLSYREEIKEPRFFGSFFFSSYVPTVQSEFSVTVPKEVTISYKLFGEGTDLIHFDKKESRNSTTYTWIASDIHKFMEDENSPNIRYSEPHIVVRINQYTIDGTTKKLLLGPSDLNEWYYSMIKDVNKNAGSGLKHVVDSLISGQKNDLDKVKKIFYWVQDNIKYVAFENGMGGFVPREASAICDKRYGDCKDMASIIVEMLNMANIRAYQTLIGTRDIPYSYQDVPMPLSVNHMIATYITNGHYYFLDGTGKNAPLELYTSMIQGKEAMLCKGENEYEIVRVPEIDKERNSTIDSTSFVIQKGQIRGSGRLLANGYQKVILSEVMLGKTQEEKIKFLKHYLLKGNNKFLIDSITCVNLDNREKELGIKYQFTINDYVTSNADELYLNLNLDKTYQNDLIDIEKRKTARVFTYKLVDQSVSAIKIPEGYTANYIPENTSYAEPHFGFDIQYHVENGQLYMNKKVYTDLLLLPPSEFEHWNAMIKRLDQAYNESIILKKSPN